MQYTRTRLDYSRLVTRVIEQPDNFLFNVRIDYTEVDESYRAVL